MSERLLIRGHYHHIGDPILRPADVELGDISGMVISITKCVCGHEWGDWEMVISQSPEYTGDECPGCGRRFFFSAVFNVYEVK